MRIVWDDAERIDRQADLHVEARDWSGLWTLARSVPVADAVRLARRITGWTPAGEAESALLTRLRETGERVERAAEAAAEAMRTTHRRLFGSAEDLAFAFGSRVLTLVQVEPPDVTRVSLLAPNGVWGDVYVGPLVHRAVACVDVGNVLAVREQAGGTDAELVHYTPGDTRAVVSGPAVAGARVVGTASGFVAGLRLTATALAAGPGLPPTTVDLAEFGFAGAHRFAVDPTGTRVAFGEGQLLLSDAGLAQVLARNAEPLPHGVAHGLAFTGPEDLVVGGHGGGLSRWRSAGDRALVPVAAADAPRLTGLFAIPAWNVVGGRADGEGVHRFYDAETLEPAGQPRAFTDAHFIPEYVHAVRTSADGRYVAVGGPLAVKASEPSFDNLLTVFDLGHPLATVLRPVAALRAHEVRVPAQATDDQRTALELARDLAALPLLL